MYNSRIKTLKSDLTLFCRDIKLVGWQFVRSSILIFFHTFRKLVFFLFLLLTSIMFKTSSFLAEKNLYYLFIIIIRHFYLYTKQMHIKINIHLNDLFDYQIKVKTFSLILVLVWTLIKFNDRCLDR